MYYIPMSLDCLGDLYCLYIHLKLLISALISQNLETSGGFKIEISKDSESYWGYKIL